MTDTDLMLSLGADISNFEKALKDAEQFYGQVTNRINTGTKNIVKIRADFKQYYKEITTAEKKYEEFIDRLKKSGQSPFTAKMMNDPNLEQYLRKYFNAVEQNEKNIVIEKEKYARRKYEIERKWQKKTEAWSERRELEKQKIEQEIKDRKVAEDKKRGLAIQSFRQQIVTERQVAQNALKERLAEFRKNKALIENEEIKSAKLVYTTRMNLWKQEQRNKQKPISQPTVPVEDKTNWDFTAHRNLIDSTLVVAKYGLISQTLYGIQGAIGSVIDEIGNFDQSIRDNMAVLGLNNVEAKGLAESVRKLAIRFGEDSQTIQKATLTLGRAGVDDVNALTKSMEALTALSIITGDTVSEGASAIASMLAVYPEYTDNVEGLANAMYAVANATKLGLQDFSTISNYALTTAKTIGLTSKSYLALSGAMSKMGLNASTIGTSIRRLEKLATDSSKDVSEFFLQIGYSQNEFLTLMKQGAEGNVKALETLTNRMTSLRTEIGDANFKDILPNDIQLRATLNTMLEMSTAGKEGKDLFKEMLNEIENADNVSKKAEISALGYNRAIVSIKESIAQIYNKEAEDFLKALFDGVTVGEFEKSLQKMVKTLKTVVSVFAEAVKIATAFWATNKLVNIYQNSIVKYVENLKLVSIAMTNSASSGSKLTRVLNIFGLNLSNLGGILKGFIGKLGLIGAGYYALSTAIDYFMPKVSENTKTLDEYNEVLSKVNKNIKEMSKTELKASLGDIGKAQLDELNKINKAREKQSKLIFEQRQAKRDGNKDEAEQIGYLIAKEQLKIDNADKYLKSSKETVKTIKDVLSGQKSVDEVLEKNIKNSDSFKQNMIEIAKEAVKVAVALNDAQRALSKSLLAGDIFSGKISKTQADKQAGEADLKAAKENRDTIQKKYEDAKAEYDKVYQRASDKENKALKEKFIALEKIRIESIKASQTVSDIENSNNNTNYENKIRLIGLETQEQINKIKEVASKQGTLNKEAQKQVDKDIASAKINGLYKELDITKDIEKRREILLEIETARIDANYEFNKITRQGNREERDRLRLLNAQMATLKAKNEQDILKAELEVGGTGQLSKEAKRIIELQGITKEIKLQEKLVKESDQEYANIIATSKDVLVIEKAKTKQLEQQNKLLKLQVSKQQLISEQEVISVEDRLKDMFKTKKGSFADNLLGEFDNLFNGITNTLKEGGSINDALTNIGTTVTGAMKNSNNPYLQAAGYAAELLGALFSSNVSQKEIDAATGRSDWSAESLKNLQDTFSNAQYPMLQVTQKMSKYLRSMDDNFGRVALAITGTMSTSGVDLTGVNFADTMKSGFLGFSSKTVQLLGTGLAFELQNLNDMMEEATIGVRGYTSTLVTKTSWWGLSSNTSTKTAFQNLPTSVREDIAQSFAYGFESIMTAGVSLGLNQANLESALKNSIIDIGRVDFTGLSPDEVSARLSAVLSESLSGVIFGISDFSTLVNRYAKSSEYALETLGRIAYEYDQASFQFSLIGKSFTNTLYSMQMQVLDIVESTGGLEPFNDAMSSFMTNFYDETEQLNFMTKAMQSSFDTLGLSMPKTNDEFRNLLETMNTSTEEGAYLYGQVLLLAQGFADMTKAADDLNGNITDITSAIKDIADAWLGNLSYLDAKQKEKYAANYYALANSSDGVMSTVDAAKAAAETAMLQAATKEEYIPVFERYIDALENQVTQDATNYDLLVELTNIKDEIVELRNSTIYATA